MTDFWAMGGYAVYVWTSYGLAAVMLAGLVGLTLWQRRRARQTWAAVNPRRESAS